MDGEANGHAHPSDAPPEYTEVPLRVAGINTQPVASVVTAPDGSAQLEADADVIAQTVELPPDPEKSADVQLDLKDPEIKDVGWNRDMGHLPPTLVHGLSNEDLFTLIRRFNKQIYQVKAIPPPLAGKLDLERSEFEEFSPDKLRSQLERFYITVIVGLAAAAKHFARVRSWNEPVRTAGFCIAYYLAWWNNLLGALFSVLAFVLVIHPPARRWLFPPAPLSAISGTSGNLQVPRAGTIGSGDSLSGAPEAHKGEAVEQEATNFVSAFASLAVGTATGQQIPTNAGRAEDVDKGEQEEGGIGGALPEPTHLTAITVDAKDVAHGGRTDGRHDKTKKHVETAIWDKARPAMQILESVMDTWERLGNALTPTHPFSHLPRLRLASLTLPILIVTTAVPSAMFMKGATFGVGFGIFGQPMIDCAIHWVTHRYPNWRELLKLNRTLLKGVPNNAQLILTLLRIGEERKTPLPPPPSANEATKTPDLDHPGGPEGALQEHDFEFDTSNYEIECLDPEGTSNQAEREEAETNPTADGKKPKSAGKLAKIFKGTTKATVSGALSLDHLKAKIGAEGAKRRLGAVPENGKAITVDGPTGSRVGMGDGPTTYAARMHGKRGYVVLVTSAASPFLSFVWEKDLSKNLASIVLKASKKAVGRDSEKDAPPAVWTMALVDMQGLKKVGGFGWKGKMIVGWALQKEVLDGLEIEDANGDKKMLTAIKGRDELFNRLIAVGGHKWEYI